MSNTPACDKCGKRKGAQSYYKCNRCGKVFCSGCVGGIFSGKCPNCGNKITNQDKI